MHSHASVKLQDIYVNGVDTLQRAMGLKQFLFGKGKFSKDYSIPILKGVNFSAKPGDRIGILGRNGSGKSSLLKVIAGIYPPQKGSRCVSGKVAPLIEMGIGFENDFTGRQNIKIGMLYNNRIENYSEELEEKIISFSGLGDKIDLPFKAYSSGMRARLAFSVAIYEDADIVLLDEAFATGDAEFIRKSEKFMKEKFDSVPISIMVTHVPQMILEVCNRCMWMESGKIIMEGKPDIVVAAYNKS